MLAGIKHNGSDMQSSALVSLQFSTILDAVLYIYCCVARGLRALDLVKITDLKNRNNA
jgi:hypothetical protein